MATTSTGSDTREREPAPGAYSPGELARRLQREVERNMLRFRNGIKYAAGIDRPGLGLTPKDTVWTHDKMELWRYRSDQRQYKTPVLMVMSLVSRSYIFDLRPGNSLVEYMRGSGRPPAGLGRDPSGYLRPHRAGARRTRTSRTA